MSATDHSPILIAEAALAEKLGVSRETLAEIRKKLAEDADWTRQKNAILFTEAGVKKIGAALALQGPLDGGSNLSGADVRTMVVKRLARRNPRVIFVVEKKGGGDLETPEEALRVREACLFVPGQEIKVQRVAGGLRLHGHQPTRRGRA